MMCPLDLTARCPDCFYLYPRVVMVILRDNGGVSGLEMVCICYGRKKKLGS